MTDSKRYEIVLRNRGGVLNSTLSNHPWHPANWMTYRGDVVSVRDTIGDEWYQDYIIQEDGE